MPEITIREIRREDFAAYKSLRLAALRDHPESFGTAFEDASEQSDAAWHERMKRSFDRDGAATFLAWDGDELAGMVAVVRDPGSKVDHYAAIYSVYVRPESRGGRLGDRLIHEAIAWCKAQGIRNVRLTVTTSNAAAVRCYARCGFTVCGIAPEVIRLGDTYHDELVMWRRV